MLNFFREMLEGWAGQNRAPTAEAAERARRQRYHNVFKNPDGEWVLADLARTHGVLQETVSSPDVTPTMIALNEGRKSAIANLIKYVEQPPEYE